MTVGELRERLEHLPTSMKIGISYEYDGITSIDLVVDTSDPEGPILWIEETH